MGAIKGPGLGEKNNELREAIRVVLAKIGAMAHELHSQNLFLRKGHTEHSGPSWKTCMAYSCYEARQTMLKYADLAPTHNKYALAEYRRNVRRLQKAIKSTPQSSAAVREHNRKQ